MLSRKRLNCDKTGKAMAVLREDNYSKRQTNCPTSDRTGKATLSSIQCSDTITLNSHTQISTIA